MREQAAIGMTANGGLDRLTLTDTDREVRDWFRAEMVDAGLNVRVDEMGNMFGRRPGTDPDAGTVLVGSHLDSQPNGGIYDGPLGVLSALEFVRSLNDHDIETKHPIEVVNWTNEEGSRFQPAMMSSGVWAGEIPVEDAYETRTPQETGSKMSLSGLVTAVRSPQSRSMSTTPRSNFTSNRDRFLTRRTVTSGIVTGIVGLRWGEVTFHGEANHTEPPRCIIGATRSSRPRMSSNRSDESLNARRAYPSVPRGQSRWNPTR